MKRWIIFTLLLLLLTGFTVFRNLPRQDMEATPLAGEYSGSGSLDSGTSYAQKVELAEDFLKELAGYRATKDKRFLILSGDPLEIRPIGGFPGTYGEITARNGNISKLLYDDLWKIDKPRQEKKLPQVNQASWWSHFPKAGKRAVQAYAEATGTNVNGVISLTPTAMEYMLEAIGPVDVPEYGVKVDSDNLLDVILKRSPYIKRSSSPNDHKPFMAVLAQRIQEKLFTASTLYRRKDLAKAVLKALEEKQMLAYMTDSKMQAMLKKENWAGEVRDVSGDFLLVSDYNAGINKVNLYVDRELDYQVSVEPDGSASAKLKITYDFKKKAFYKKYGSLSEDKFSAYRNLMRVYVPEGSELISVRGFDQPVKTGRETGKTVFSNQVVLLPYEKRTFTLRYKLPFLIKNYRLLMQKQPGTPIVRKGSTYKQSFRMILPKNMHMSNYSPESLLINENTVNGALDIEKDQTIIVEFE